MLLSGPLWLPVPELSVGVVGKVNVGSVKEITVKHCDFPYIHTYIPLSLSPPTFSPLSVISYFYCVCVLSLGVCMCLCDIPSILNSPVLNHVSRQ